MKPPPSYSLGVPNVVLFINHLYTWGNHSTTYYRQQLLKNTFSASFKQCAPQPAHSTHDYISNSGNQMTNPNTTWATSSEEMLDTKNNIIHYNLYESFLWLSVFIIMSYLLQFQRKKLNNINDRCSDFKWKLQPPDLERVQTWRTQHWAQMKLQWNLTMSATFRAKSSVPAVSMDETHQTCLSPLCKYMIKKQLDPYLSWN